jgi:hypothetical protein
MSTSPHRNSNSKLIPPAVAHRVASLIKVHFHMKFNEKFDADFKETLRQKCTYSNLITIQAMKA